MSGPILTISDISVETQNGGVRRTLVDGASLSVRGGEVVALVGPSGSGKSLTCGACLDVLPAGTARTGGTVAIDGVVHDPARLRGHHIATIMQNPRSAFNPVRTMRDHAEETLHALAVPRSERHDRIIDAMRQAGLDDPARVLALHPFEMSGGMLQRMMIALALASDAPFLFADEPTTDLDLFVQRDILDLIDRLRVENGIGILLVTHDMGVVARLADRVAVMDGGRIVEQADIRALFEHPAHSISKRLVGAHLSLYDLAGAA